MDKQEQCVIIHKNKVFKSLLFNSISQARNALRFCYPKRNFKEPIKNTFVCSHYGTKFEIVLLNEYPS